ncbi:FecR domain-containing protein [Marinobacter apostichopi]|uniref:FecR domain-containing protein n=1 Tax=Marinobacter apostichopi TaxID=3035454 RepID=UPI002572CE93|nr:FecR domain-containing protein [Marinobacter sp. LA51]
MNTLSFHTAKVPFQTSLFLVILFLLFADVARAEPVVIEAMTGTAEFRNHSEDAWQPLNAGDALKVPVEIQTGPDSSVQIGQSGTFFDVSAETRLHLSTNDASSDGLISRVKQWFGTVFYDVERQPDTFKVETPFLVSTVKGTQFTIVSTDEASFVTLKEGRLEVVDNKTGTRRILNPGDIASVSGDGTGASFSSLIQIPDALPAVAQEQALQIASMAPSFGLDQQTEMGINSSDSSAMSGITSLASLTLGGEIGAELTADLGSDLGLNVGADLGTDVGADIGSDLIGDISAEINADLGIGAGLDDGLELEADLDLGPDLDIDIDLDDLEDLDGLDDLEGGLQQILGGLGGSGSVPL